MKYKHQFLAIWSILWIVSCTVTNMTSNENNIIDGPQEGDENYYREYIDPKTPGIIAVDLGLSVKWGDRNLGSESISDYGGLYVWADPSGRALNFDNETIPFTEISGTEYDIAAAHLPKGWRLPTIDEVRELINRCNGTTVSENGTYGCRMTSKDNGSSIFFPFAGYRYEDKIGFGTGNAGFYWTGTCDDYEKMYATYFYFGSPNDLPQYKNVDYGISVRPVYDKESDNNEDILPEGELFTTVISTEINLHRGDIASAFRGSGTENDPYLISNATELRKLADDVNSGNVFRNRYFRMTDDITINEKVLDDEGNLNSDISSFERWIPIGGKANDNNSNYTFAGIFDGNGHTISGIMIVNEYEDFYSSNSSKSQGLFGKVSGIVRNLTLRDSYIYYGSFVGLLCDSYSVNGKSFEGEATIELCSNYATIEGFNVGGICARATNAIINKCINYGKVKSENRAGGICGVISYYSKIINCINRGEVYSQNYSGGICGYQYDTNAINCLNTGHIISKSGYIGGISSYIGSYNFKTTISNCLNYGTADYDPYMNGGIGYEILRGSIIYSNCYFISTFAEDLYFTSSPGVEVTMSGCSSISEKELKSSAFLKKLNSNTDALGTDYSAWVSGADGYPTLDWTSGI